MPTRSLCAPFVFVAAAASSCVLVHEREGDASAPTGDAALLRDAPTRIDAFAGGDAFVGTDAGPDARYFTLELALVDLVVADERCDEIEAATGILRVTTHFFSTCDSPGPIDVVLDATARTITIVPHVWLEHGRADCTSVDAAYERDVALEPSAGSWTIVGPFPSIAYEVRSQPGPFCPGPGNAAGIMCRGDCDCAAGLSCLAVRGDAACARFCADPCETPGGAPDVGLLCPFAEVCTSDPNLGWICAASTTTNACDEMHPCPAGMMCPAVSEGRRTCEWTVALDPSARGLCSTASDCGAGLDCVQRVDGYRSCEVRCTTRDMVCPFGHVCWPPSWVCERLGP